MPALKFTVDSALLEELGERLIGKPYIALAELVKNSYDADSPEATIEVAPEHDRIVVSDKGQGMDYEEFKDFWMRIGSTHKQRQRISRRLGRPLTGSKGVGRLAVQYLASRLDLSTTSEKDPSKRLEAHVEWEKAVKAGNLTEATVEYEIKSSDRDFEKGTTIILTGLKEKEKWEPQSIKKLAGEIWWLQPPFRSPLDTEDHARSFEIEFLSPREDYVKIFNEGMRAILNIWYARLVGRNVKGNVSLSLQFVGEEPYSVSYSTPNGDLKRGDFEIRIYLLEYRQPHGIKVAEAREYFNEFGGVHVYDGGFHLPYYGNQKNDWLGVEIDHSHRLSSSQLLPAEWSIDRGLQFLPTLSRVFGVVNVDTSNEDNLKILITRDRLQESDAFEDLRYMVRWALDFYALEEKKKMSKAKSLIAETETPKFQKVEDVLTKYEPDIPKKTYEKLRKDIRETTAHIETEAEAAADKIGLIGPLATAGISSVAYQHELRRQFSTIDDIVKRISAIKVKDEELQKTLDEVKESLSSLVEQARRTNAIFAYFGNAENLKTRERFPARKTIEQIRDQVKFLMRGVPIDTSKVNDQLLLPKASLVEWGAIFQNVFINAFNAMLDSDRKLIEVSSRIDGRNLEILVQDTGCGVDLKEAESLFEPFVRKVKISTERQALGYGGMGLGLTIVRMIAHNVLCEISFVKPQKGFSTAFSLRWRESG
jgi:signal transduction histidine kinase